MKKFCKKSVSIEKVGKKYFQGGKGELLNKGMKQGHFNVSDVIE